ncbi:MAG: TusE/DsrC/DsvC family sulfur relay protein [Pseudomonadota bacterium]|nr:TusE/DsrC/DsvC family sulfur relay protein [Pseudomonadota bacterium]
MNGSLGVALDDDGFLEDSDAWSEPIARRMAADLGIPDLGNEHLSVIRDIREHCLEHASLCAMEIICDRVGMEKHCVRRLFRGPVEAWKISGMPNPGLEALTYMKNEE